MVASLYHPEMVIKGYELAKAGMSEIQISGALGISFPTFRVWIKKKGAFRVAIKMGRKAHRGIDGKGFRNYIYDRLSTKLQGIWDELNRLDKAKCGVERIQALLADKGVKVRQHLFIHAWTSSLFSISKAIRMVGISKITFDKWCREDPDFVALTEEITFHKKNFFEDAAISLVAAGDSPATVQINRAINKDRGYNEKVDVNVNVSGQIQHQLTVLKIGELNLPLSTKKQILKAMRSRRKIIHSEEVKSTALQKV